MLRFVRPIPISAGHARRRHPDLADLRRGARDAGCRIHDAHVRGARNLSARDERRRLRRVAGALCNWRDDVPASKRISVGIAEHRLVRKTARRHDKRRLCQPVHRIERPPPKSPVGKSAVKRGERLRSNRLRPIVGDAPRREIEEHPGRWLLQPFYPEREGGYASTVTTHDCTKPFHAVKR